MPAAWPAAPRRVVEEGTQGPLPREHGILLVLRCPGRGAWIGVLASVQTLNMCGLVEGRGGFK